MLQSIDSTGCISRKNKHIKKQKKAKQVILVDKIIGNIEPNGTIPNLIKSKQNRTDENKTNSKQNKTLMLTYHHHHHQGNQEQHDERCKPWAPNPHNTHTARLYR